MNIHAYIVNKILANLIEQHIKKMIQQDQFVLNLWNVRMAQYVKMIHHINRTKDKNHKILSIDAEKALTKCEARSC